MTTDFVAHIDPSHTYAKIVVGAEERLLRVGEWSDWVPVQFELAWGDIRAECRFYLKQLEPDFVLYVTPAQPRSARAGAAGFVPAHVRGGPGRRHRAVLHAGHAGGHQEPEDRRADTVRVPGIRRESPRTKTNVNTVTSSTDATDGFLFYYFGHVDQVSHMMWRAMDPQHPAYDPKVDPQYSSVVENLYEEMDGIVGRTLPRLRRRRSPRHHVGPRVRLLAPRVQLNSWLRDNGYLKLRRRPTGGADASFDDIDWSGTRAYGIGLNGLYINLRGRGVGRDRRARRT